MKSFMVPSTLGLAVLAIDAWLISASSKEMAFSETSK
jgi:hypothetical protein